MLCLRIYGIEMPLDTSEERTEIGDLRRQDDAGVRTASSLPFCLDTMKIPEIEGQDCAFLPYGELKLVFIGNLQFATASLASAQLSAS
jgi:hypothetical protein